MTFPKTIRQRSLIASTITLICASLAQAQESKAPQELTTTVVEGESIKRDAVVDVLTSDDINARQIDDFDELVKLIPGVSVSKGDDRWGSSGFNIRGLDEDRVAINVDGVPQGETLKYESGQAYGYFKGSRNGVDIESLKAVEIVKGADGILSGNGALAGAVNMTTKDASDILAVSGNDTGLAVKTEYSSVNDESMASLTAANRFGKVESLLIYTKRKGHEHENYDMDGADVAGSRREIPDPQDNELDSALAKVFYHFSPTQKLGLVGSYYDKNRISDNQSYNGGWYANRVGDDHSKTARVGLEYELTADLLLFDNISATLNQQTVETLAETTQSVNIPPRTDENRVDTRNFDQELTHLTLDFTKAFALASLQHKLNYGLERQDKEFENRQIRTANSRLNTRGWVTTNIGALLPHAEAEIATLYALDTFALNDSTQLRMGARYDDYEYRANSDANYTDRTGTLQPVSFSASTWTAGIEHMLTTALKLELGVSSGFRAPTIEEMYSTAGSPTDWSTVANPDLKAESSTNIDLALSGQFEQLYLRVGVFQSQYEDFIDTQSRTGINPNINALDPNGWNTPVNFGEVEMKGLELSSALNLDTVTPGLSSGLQAAYTEGERSNGDPVYSVQPFRVVWTVGYNAPNGRWGLNSFTTHTSGKKNSDSFQTNAAGVRVTPLYLSNTATIIDLVSYVNLSEGLRMTAGVHNLTDKEYYNWDSVRFVDQGDLRPGIGVEGNGVRRYSEPGRNYEVGIHYQY
jgi:hemoglobin/transferrin/lactoferrin receptor protein